MKAPILLALLAGAASAFGQVAAPLYRPPQPLPVVSPLTNTTAQSGQALLDQINTTLQQRALQRQLLNLQMSPVQGPAILVTQPVIRTR